MRRHQADIAARLDAVQHTLERSPGLSMVELCSMLLLSRKSMSYLLDVLISDGRVLLERDRYRLARTVTTFSVERPDPAPVDTTLARIVELLDRENAWTPKGVIRSHFPALTNAQIGRDLALLVERGQLQSRRMANHPLGMYEYRTARTP